MHSTPGPLEGNGTCPLERRTHQSAYPFPGGRSCPRAPAGQPGVATTRMGRQPDSMASCGQTGSAALAALVLGQRACGAPPAARPRRSRRRKGCRWRGPSNRCSGSARRRLGAGGGQAAAGGSRFSLGRCARRSARCQAHSWDGSEHASVKDARRLQRAAPAGWAARAGPPGSRTDDEHRLVGAGPDELRAGDEGHDKAAAGRGEVKGGGARGADLGLRQPRRGASEGRRVGGVCTQRRSTALNCRALAWGQAQGHPMRPGCPVLQASGCKHTAPARWWRCRRRRLGWRWPELSSPPQQGRRLAGRGGRGQAAQNWRQAECQCTQPPGSCRRQEQREP